jgi:hypothetical protein
MMRIINIVVMVIMVITMIIQLHFYLIIRLQPKSQLQSDHTSKEKTKDTQSTKSRQFL